MDLKYTLKKFYSIFIHSRLLGIYPKLFAIAGSTVNTVPKIIVTRCGSATREAGSTDSCKA